MNGVKDDVEDADVDDDDVDDDMEVEVEEKGVKKDHRWEWMREKGQI